jgi:peptide/nickel transport system permease protein
MAVITPVTTETVVSSGAFWRQKGYPVIPVLVLLLIAFVAVFADLLAPHDPQVGSLARRFKPPFWLEGGSLVYPLGTDHVGRDVLSRIATYPVHRLAELLPHNWKPLDSAIQV